MKKNYLLLSCLSISVCMDAQTIFTFGNKTVSKAEFLQAYKKNSSLDSNRSDALQQYLDLYIRFKLKVQAAYDDGADKDPNFLEEAANFKKQLSENSINDEANLNQLVQEAEERSKKDIEVSQVFIEVPKGADTTAAYQKIQEAYSELKKGKSFAEIAATFSNDEATKQAKGNIGFITVFTLPYEIENIIYQLSAGNFSLPYHSNIGYHIFKNNGERKALGKRKIMQVLLMLPSSATNHDKQVAASEADSLYNLLQSGISFTQIEKKYNPGSNNFNSIEVSVGQFSTDFEKEVFALQNPGDITKPFETIYGFHIVKLLEIIPIKNNYDDAVAKASIQEKVQQDDRLSVAKKSLVHKWLITTKYSPAKFDAKALTAYTDSALHGHSLKGFTTISPNTILFSFDKQKITVADWLTYAKASKPKNSKVPATLDVALLKEFTLTKCAEYYHEHLVEYNTALHQQIQEFNEANLLFAVMDKHVWSKASEDSFGLRKYYADHKSNFNWKPSVTALLVTAESKQIGEEVAAKLKENIANWRMIINSYGTQIEADSSRFEQDQLPIKQSIQLQSGILSQPELNGADNTVSFIYIFNVYPNQEPRSFDDARGMLINDYQQIVEDNWLIELKKKYPVTINKEVFHSIH